MISTIININRPDGATSSQTVYVLYVLSNGLRTELFAAARVVCAIVGS